MKEVKFDKEEAALIRKLLEADKSETSSKIARKLDRAEKPISISSRKSKGREFQYDVCEKIAEAAGLPYDQHDPNCDIHSNEMGQAGADVILRNEARKRFPFSVECKAQENVSLKEFVEQARANVAADSRSWLLAIKKKSVGKLAVLELDEFMAIWKELLELRKK